MHQDCRLYFAGITVRKQWSYQNSCFCARSPNAVQWFGQLHSLMFRFVPRIWILCDHFWLLRELRVIGFGFEDMVVQRSPLKRPELKLAVCVITGRWFGSVNDIQ